MPVRKLSAIESLLALYRFAKDNWHSIVGIFTGAGTVMALAWKYIQLVALNVGWWFYPAFFLGLLFAFWGLASLIFILRGDIGFRRVILAQLRAGTQAEYLAARDQYLKIATEITAFMADRKEREPTPWAGSLEDWEAHRVSARKHENEGQARFVERFGSRIISLMILLKKLGANDDLVHKPLWTVYTWPDHFLTECGHEFTRLGMLYEDDKRHRDDVKRASQTSYLMTLGCAGVSPRRGASSLNAAFKVRATASIRGSLARIDPY